MAHYAYLDDNNTVTAVIVGRHENEEGVNWEQYYGAIRCSYNTQGGQHVHGGTPFRFNFPGVGWTFNPNHGPDGAFIPPQPYPSWTLNPATALWEAPVARPDDEMGWRWDEDRQAWVAL